MKNNISTKNTYFKESEKPRKSSDVDVNVRESPKLENIASFVNRWRAIILAAGISLCVYHFRYPPWR